MIFHEKHSKLLRICLWIHMRCVVVSNFSQIAKNVISAIFVFQFWKYYMIIDYKIEMPINLGYWAWSIYITSWLKVRKILNRYPVCLTVLLYAVLRITTIEIHFSYNVTLQFDGAKDVINVVLFTWGGVLGVGDGRVARVVAGVVALSATEGAGSGQGCVALLVHGVGAGPVNGSRYSRHVSAKCSLLCCHHRCDNREITCLSSLSYWSFM